MDKDVIQFTYIEKSIGPKFDPWGTPAFTIFTDEQEPFTETYSYCLVFTFSQIRTKQVEMFPRMP